MSLVTKIVNVVQVALIMSVKFVSQDIFYMKTNLAVRKIAIMAVQVRLLITVTVKNLAKNASKIACPTHA